jgi:Flp pilus assembly pilin Flp
MSDAANATVSSTDSSVRALIVRVFRDENGQDLIEYGLLGAFIGTVGIFTWQAIGSSIGTHYSGWDTAVQSLSSCTPDSGLTGC